MWDVEGHKKDDTNKPLTDLSKFTKVYVFTKLNLRPFNFLYECKKTERKSSLPTTELTNYFIFSLFFLG